MRRLLPALLLPLLLHCGTKETDTNQGRQVLRIGTDATYPPFETVNMETGQPDGFDIDLLKAICARNGWRAEFIVTPFDGMIPGLTARKYDVAVSAITITPERAAVVAFSDPYYLAGQTIAVPVDDTVITGPEDLRGMRVGTQLGTTGEIMAKRMDGVHVYSFDNIGAAFIDMANGNLDAVLNDFPTTQAYIRAHGTAKTVGEILSEEHYGIATRKADAELRQAINNALGHIRTDGTYDSLHVKWFGVPPAEPAAEPQDTTSPST